MPPKNPPKIYIDSSMLIDLAKHNGGIRMNDADSENTNRESNVWCLRKLLEAARLGEVKLFTSSLSVTECTTVEKGKQPNKAAQQFYQMLLRSGKSGIKLIQPTMTIMDETRDMKWRGDESFSLKSADSIHLATAIHCKCSELLTTDKDFARLHYKESARINVIPARQTELLPPKFRQQELMNEKSNAKKRQSHIRTSIASLRQ